MSTNADIIDNSGGRITGGKVALDLTAGVARAVIGTIINGDSLGPIWITSCFGC